ncbi:MAG: hypothetical protein KDB80_04200, partial [Planctomycetes bacterium]|nr:hypothetical protein [Planctomycetota bacterium]
MSERIVSADQSDAAPAHGAAFTQAQILGALADHAFRSMVAIRDSATSQTAGQLDGVLEDLRGFVSRCAVRLRDIRRKLEEHTDPAHGIDRQAIMERIRRMEAELASVQTGET